MKKLAVWVLVLCLTLCLAACGGEEAPAATESVPPEVTAEPTPEPTPEALTAEALSGYWHLSDSGNKMSVLRELFPGLKEQGACMEIRANGQITWYIGKTGATGTFRIDGNRLEATLTADPSGEALYLNLMYSEKNGRRTLSMDAKDMLVYWSPGKGDASGEWPGAWKLDYEAALWDSEGLRPSSYDSLGGGIYQVYVVQDGREIPWARVDSATGETLPDE